MEKGVFLQWMLFLKFVFKHIVVYTGFGCLHMGNNKNGIKSDKCLVELWFEAIDKNTYKHTSVLWPSILNFLLFNFIM